MFPLSFDLHDKSTGPPSSRALSYVAALREELQSDDGSPRTKAYRHTAQDGGAAADADRRREFWTRRWNRQDIGQSRREGIRTLTLGGRCQKDL